MTAMLGPISWLRPGWRANGRLKWANGSGAARMAGAAGTSVAGRVDGNLPIPRPDAFGRPPAAP
ncbi:hypothetical protein [Roseateles sp. P5_E11]